MQYENVESSSYAKKTNAFKDHFHNVVNFNVSKSKPRTSDDNSVKNRALDHNEEQFKHHIESGHAKLDDNYESEGNNSTN